MTYKVEAKLLIITA